MAVTYIFQEGEPVKSNEVNQDFADVLNTITEAVAGSSSTLTAKIDEVKTTANSALSKANNSVQLSGNQTISGQKTFNNLVKVPNSTAIGVAIANAGRELGNNGYQDFGTGLRIQWGGQNVSGGSGFITLNKPFADTNYKVVAIHQGGSNSAVSLSSASGAKTTSRFTVITGSNSSMSTQWIAVGRWS